MIREKELSTISGLVALPVLLALICFSSYTMVRAFMATASFFGRSAGASPPPSGRSAWPGSSW